MTIESSSSNSIETKDQVRARLTEKIRVLREELLTSEQKLWDLGREERDEYDKNLLDDAKEYVGILRREHGSDSPRDNESLEKDKERKEILRNRFINGRKT